MASDSSNKNDQEVLEDSARSEQPPLEKGNTDEGSNPKKDIPAFSAQTPGSLGDFAEQLKAKFPHLAYKIDLIKDETEAMVLSNDREAIDWMDIGFNHLFESLGYAEQLIRRITEEEAKCLAAQDKLAKEKKRAELFEEYLATQKSALIDATLEASTAEAKYDALLKEHENLVAAFSENQDRTKILEAEKQALEEEKKVLFEVLEAEKQALKEEKKVFLEEKIVIEQGIDAALEESRTIAGDRAEMYDEFNAILEAMIEEIRAKAKVFQRQRMALTAKGLMQGMRKSGEN